jgi:hypothetical protein
MYMKATGIRYLEKILTKTKINVPIYLVKNLVIRILNIKYKH